MTAELLYHVEDENNSAAIATNENAGVITFTGTSGDTVVDFEATFTWTMGDSGVKPALTITGAANVA